MSTKHAPVHLVKQTSAGNAYMVCVPMVYLSNAPNAKLTGDTKRMTCPACQAAMGILPSTVKGA